MKRRKKKKGLFSLPCASVTPPHFCGLSCATLTTQAKQSGLVQAVRLVFVWFNGRGFEEGRNPHHWVLVSSWGGLAGRRCWLPLAQLAVGMHIYLLPVYWLETASVAFFSSFKMRKL